MKGTCFEVHFKFKDEEHVVKIYTVEDYLEFRPAVCKINELIKDTGYQYCSVSSWVVSDINYVVLSQEEIKKLKKRGWELSYP